MTSKTRFFVSLAVALCAAGSAVAENRLDVDMGRFPKGTACAVSGTSGKVSMRETRKEIKFKIRGDTAKVVVDCTLPDGQQVFVDTSPFVRKDTSMTSLQLNSDNTGAVLWDKGGIKIQNIDGFLRKR